MFNKKNIVIRIIHNDLNKFYEAMVKSKSDNFFGIEHIGVMDKILLRGITKKTWKRLTKNLNKMNVVYYGVF